MLNYFYDREAGVYELYYGNTLIVELPYADPMNDEQAGNLASELFNQYMTEHKAKNV